MLSYNIHSNQFEVNSDLINNHDLNLSLQPFIVQQAIPLLFDIFQGPRIGLSLKKLSSSYNGPCIKVKRSSDNTEQDIAFNNENLDTTSLLNFVGQNHGYVTKIYDQSGNGIDFNGTNLLIVSNGTLVLENGHPAISFSSTSTLSHNGHFDFDTTNFLLSTLIRIDTIYGGNPRILGIVGLNTNFQLGFNSSLRYFIRSNNTTRTSSSNLLATTNKRVLLTATGSNSVYYFSEDTISDNLLPNSPPTANSVIGTGFHFLKGYYSSSHYISSGNFQEMIFFDSDQLVNKVEIEQLLIAKY